MLGVSSLPSLNPPPENALVPLLELSPVSEGSTGTAPASLKALKKSPTFPTFFFFGPRIWKDEVTQSGSWLLSTDHVAGVGAAPSVERLLLGVAVLVLVIRHQVNPTSGTSTRGRLGRSRSRGCSPSSFNLHPGLVSVSLVEGGHGEVKLPVGGLKVELRSLRIATRDGLQCTNI